MRFEGADGPFQCVAAVEVCRYKLELASPLLSNGQFVGFTGLVVHNL